MTNVHVLADESLGGVLREYVEVDRKTLEPTDIVVIDGKRYLMVERKAEVGDKVIVTNAENTFGKYGNGSVLVAEETLGIGIYNKNVITEELGCNPNGFIAHDEYRVLVLLEDATESEASPSVVDMLSNLALRLMQLERKVNEMSDRQAHTCEQPDTQKVERLKHSGNGAKIKPFRLSDLSGKTVKIESATDYGRNGDLTVTTTVAYDVEEGKVYVLGSEVHGE